MSNSSWHNGLHHARLPWPSPTPEVCSNSCTFSQWWHPTISSSVIPFFSCLQSFPASGSFPMIWLFTANGQLIGASASASVLPVNTQDWFPLGLTGLISLQSKRHFQESSPALQFNSINSSVLSLLYGPALTLWLLHEYHCSPNTGICYGSWIFMSVQLPNIQEALGRCRDWFLLIIW